MPDDDEIEKACRDCSMFAEYSCDDCGCAQCEMCIQSEYSPTMIGYKLCSDCEDKRWDSAKRGIAS